MRIRKNANHHLDEGETAPTHVKVEVSYDGEENKPNANGNGNWIGLERSFGDGVAVSSSSLYCVGTSSSAGKRKYFTYDLVDPALTAKVGTGKETKPLHNSTKLYVPIPENSVDNECVWIYVDECTAASEAKDAKRSATIRVTYGTGNSDVTFKPLGEINYTINQHKLFKLTYEGRTYHIEHEEEYLHNFDAETAYGDESNKTEFQGMEWGLPEIELSHLHEALFITYTPKGWTEILDFFMQLLGAGTMEEFCNNAVKKSVNPVYDFYLTRDGVKKITPRDYQGIAFNQEIAAHLSGKTDVNAKIEKIQLDEIPKSAFAYCYNRNKRKADGNVVAIDWFLPAIDEIEDIMKSGHSYFDDFHGKYYWSCQPSYIMNNFSISMSGENLTGTFFIENKDRARATKAELGENNQFKEVESSASDLYATKYGSIETNWLGIPKNYVDGKYEPVANFDDEYKNHPGNRPRTDKCRVRAVRKIN